MSFVIFFTEKNNFFIIKLKNYLENVLFKVKWLKLKKIEWVNSLFLRFPKPEFGY